jgi:hypothetical protein
MEITASIDKPKEGENHQESILPSFELAIVNMISLNPSLEELVGASNRPPSIDPFQPWLSFQNFPLISLPSLPPKIFVSYLFHLLMGPIKELW